VKDYIQIDLKNQASQVSLYSQCYGSGSAIFLSMRILLLGAFVFFCVGSAIAQSITGDLVATVTDPTGAVIPKAALVLTQGGHSADNEP